jgi:hypothetical protein
MAFGRISPFFYNVVSWALRKQRRYATNAVVMQLIVRDVRVKGPAGIGLPGNERQRHGPLCTGASQLAI